MNHNEFLKTQELSRIPGWNVEFKKINPIELQIYETSLKVGGGKEDADLSIFGNEWSL